MYGAIVAAMLSTGAAAPDCYWWGGCYTYYAAPCYYYYPCYYPCYYYYPAYYYPCYRWPAVTYEVPAVRVRPAATEREQALEAEIKALRDQLRKLQGGKPRPDDMSAAPAPARVVVTLPADARLFVQDDPCPLTSAKRSFDTPELRPGVEYHYTIRAEVVREGRVVKESKRVSVRAGEETAVEFGDMRSVETAGR